jgi:hypothetical protein
MNRDILTSDKFKLSDKLKSLAAEIELLDLSASSTGLKNFNKAVVNAVYKGERIVKEMRNFAALSAMRDTDIYEYDLTVAAKQLEISIACRESGLVEVIIPVCDNFLRQNTYHGRSGFCGRRHNYFVKFIQ